MFIICSKPPWGDTWYPWDNHDSVEVFRSFSQAEVIAAHQRRGDHGWEYEVFRLEKAVP